MEELNLILLSHYARLNCKIYKILFRVRRNFDSDFFWAETATKIWNSQTKNNINFD